MWFLAQSQETLWRAGLEAHLSVLSYFPRFSKQPTNHMIPYFRKIRKKMADDNRPLKYRRYAIGEIVLVVIGILIALQINTWNEDRKQKKKEVKLLENLMTSLKSDLNQMNRNIKAQRKIPSSAKLLIEYFDKDLQYNDSLKYHFGNTTHLFIWDADKAVYETIKTLGADVITNEQLRKNIASYYHLTENSFPRKTKFYQDYLQSSINDIHKTRFNQLWGQRNIKTVIETLNIDSVQIEMTPLDYEKLKTDQEYRFFLQTISNMHEWFIEFEYTMQSDRLNFVIPEIEEEIKKLNQ